MTLQDAQRATVSDWFGDLPRHISGGIRATILCVTSHYNLGGSENAMRSKVKLVTGFRVDELLGEQKTSD